MSPVDVTQTLLYGYLVKICEQIRTEYKMKSQGLEKVSNGFMITFTDSEDNKTTLKVVFMIDEENGKMYGVKFMKKGIIMWKETGTFQFASNEEPAIMNYIKSNIQKELKRPKSKI